MCVLRASIQDHVFHFTIGKRLEVLYLIKFSIQVFKPSFVYFLMH